MDQKSLKPVRQRRSYTPEFKAELVAHYLDGDDSLASLAMDHGMNPNVLHRWVREHERYGKHSLQDDGDGSLIAQARDMSPANWIPLNSSPNTTHRQTVAPTKIVEADQPGQISDTIALELAGRGMSLTLRWPVHEHQALADWTRALLR